MGTNRHHVVQILMQEFVHTLGAVTRDIDADLLHRANCIGIHYGGFGSCAEGAVSFTVKSVHKSFGHVRPS